MEDVLTNQPIVAHAEKKVIVPEPSVFEKPSKKYIEAEKRWEKDLMKETTKLLKKLEPAGAFLIPVCAINSIEANM